MDLSRAQSLENRQDTASLPETGPLPIPKKEAWALFLDIDGTIANLASTPSEAVVPEPMLKVLHSLKSGAVALMSGREIASIDAMTKPYRFAASGQHGFEIRSRPDASIVLSDGGKISLKDIFDEAEMLAERFSGLIIERKSGGLALHYRNALESQMEASRLLRHWVERFPEQLSFQEGKMVYEVKQKNVNKGLAINVMMKSPPFYGKKPVFMGDDLTDEAGFNAVNEMGGISVKIGAGPTHARLRLYTPEQARDWLMNIVATLNEM